jgi:hypothetical protein
MQWLVVGWLYMGVGDGLLMSRTEDVIVDFGESDIDGGRPIC